MQISETESYFAEANPPPHPHPQIFAKFNFLWTEKENSVKVKNSTNYKTSWNSSKFVDIYNMIIELNARDGIPCQ